MDTKQLDDALARLFIDEGARIVFWHDPEHEFVDFMNRLPFLTFGDTTVHLIRLDQVSALATKIRLERDEPDSRFLLYAPTEEPDYADDWLLDIRLYSRSFRADRASIILTDCAPEGPVCGLPGPNRCGRRVCTPQPLCRRFSLRHGSGDVPGLRDRAISV